MCLQEYQAPTKLAQTEYVSMTRTRIFSRLIALLTSVFVFGIER